MDKDIKRKEINELKVTYHNRIIDEIVDSTEFDTKWLGYAYIPKEVIDKYNELYFEYLQEHNIKSYREIPDNFLNTDEMEELNAKMDQLTEDEQYVVDLFVQSISEKMTKEDLISNIDCQTVAGICLESLIDLFIGSN
jgi:vancomycin resistance protein YoaR